ncbi:protein N-terminal asparagine amidohydrolase isoform X1 [Chiroxiphia lanceolata]|uniref:protein N-terminal asparagine amidohydrolase isoform X1 n=1 Tax=Chiroxiphia lanceolata TaxID=296741 RepID=UPI0013CE88D3|nr:protein N-terminal asparagine amidohydrolase isoform X1 [Chiroxiphia lanceolata]
MPLLVNGARVDLSRPTGDMIRAHPHLEEKAKLLRSQPAQTVEPKGLLYVQQREFAVTTPKDGSVSILGSDDATTCHIVVLRHTGSGATCLTHCDGSDTEAEVSLIMSSVKSLSNPTGCGRLEVHLVGGFNDDRQLSQKLTNQLLRAFDLQPDDVHLVTFCVTELNDREEQDIHFPIIYGIAVNVKTAEIFPATFPEKGPDEDLRSAHVLTGAPVSKNNTGGETVFLSEGETSWDKYPKSEETKSFGSILWVLGLLLLFNVAFVRTGSRYRSRKEGLSWPTVCLGQELSPRPSDQGNVLFASVSPV